MSKRHSEPANYTALNDGELMARVTEQNPAALATLYDRHAAAIYRMALSLTHQPVQAEEVVQEVFIKLWRRPDRYQPQRGAFLNWVLGVTHNQAIDTLARERRYAEMSRLATSTTEDDALLPCDPADPLADPATTTWRRVRGDTVRRLITHLPAPQREVIELAYFSGLSQSRIAGQLAQPLGTVKTRTVLALQKLRRMLNGGKYDWL